MYANPYQQYKEQALSTLTQGEVLVKLYDEVIKQLSVAKIKIGQNDLGAANDSFIKCQTIVSTLAGSLDMRYPISKELRDMYVFLSKHMLEANMKKDTGMIDDCIPLVRDLRDSFEEADKINRRSAPRRVSVAGQAV